VGEENRGRGEMVTEGRGKPDIGLREVRDQQGKEGNELLGREGDKAHGEKGRRREENGMRKGKGDSKKERKKTGGLKGRRTVLVLNRFSFSLVSYRSF